MKTFVIVLAVLAVVLMGVGMYIRMRLDPMIRSGLAYIPGTKQWINPGYAAAYRIEMISFALSIIFVGVAAYLFYRS